jgi:hydroxymethylbilane synthase
MADLRGNVGTRLHRLDDGEFEGIVLAAAGVKRLGLDSRVRQYLEPEIMLPAIGQGVIGIECRDGDRQTLDRIQPLHHSPTEICVRAERALNHRLHGGCQVPIACHARLDGGNLRLTALVGRVDGSEIVRGRDSGPAHDAASLGIRLAEDLLARGARQILDELTTGVD